MYSLESAVDAPLRLFYRATIIALTPLGASLIAAAGGGPRGTPDRSMLRLLAQAHRYREMMLEAQGRTMPDLAREAGVGRPYFCRIVRLGFLAPDVVKAVLRDRHPPELTAKRLSLHTKLPSAWEDQISPPGIV